MGEKSRPSETKLQSTSPPPPWPSSSLISSSAHTRHAVSVSCPSLPTPHPWSAPPSAWSLRTVLWEDSTLALCQSSSSRSHTPWPSSPCRVKLPTPSTRPSELTTLRWAQLETLAYHSSLVWLPELPPPSSLTLQTPC